MVRADDHGYQQPNRQRSLELIDAAEAGLGDRNGVVAAELRSFITALRVRRLKTPQLEQRPPPQPRHTT